MMNYADKYVTDSKKAEKPDEKRIILPDGYYALVEAINRLADVIGAKN